MVKGISETFWVDSTVFSSDSTSSVPGLKSREAKLSMSEALKKTVN